MKRLIYPNLYVKLVLIVCCFSFNCCYAQTNLELGKELKSINIKQKEELGYSFEMEKGQQYKVQVMQIGIDLVIRLYDQNGKLIQEKDSPNGLNGPEEFDYIASKSEKFTLKVVCLEDPQNSPEGKFNILIKKYTKAELDAIAKEKIRKETAYKLTKDIETSDIDNFWNAIKILKTSNTHLDSVKILRENYFNKGSEGLKLAFERLDYTPEKLLKEFSSKSKFFLSAKKNMESTKGMSTLIKSMVTKYKDIYPSFKPFKVVFLVANAGGGADVFVNGGFLVVNLSNVCHTNEVDVSELKQSEKEFVVRENDVYHQVMERLGHEATHFEHKTVQMTQDPNCALLNGTLIESACDYIAEVVTGKPVILRKAAYEYGLTHKEEVWKMFQKDMCSPKPEKEWLFNKDENGLPGNLGFSIGHQILDAYRSKITEKGKALIDIIELNNPSNILKISGFEDKMR